MSKLDGHGNCVVAAWISVMQDIYNPDTGYT